MWRPARPRRARVAPGTDADGITDHEALTRTHFALLRDRSFRLGLRRGDAAVSARQADGMAGRRFLRARTARRERREGHAVDVVTMTDVWHGEAMAPRAEVRRRRELLVPDDPTAFADGTGQDPPVESVTYDRVDGNRALVVQGVHLDAVLDALAFGRPERFEFADERRVRFPVVGPAEGAADRPEEAATASGWLTARLDGLLRTVRVTPGPGVGDDGDHLAMDVGDLDGREVGDQPAWVDQVPG